MAERYPAPVGEKSTARKVGDQMSSAVEARDLIEEIVGPVKLGTRLKTVLPWVAELTGLTPRRIRGIWNMEAKAVLGDELNALRRAKEEAIHARNLATLSLLARRGAAAAMGSEDVDC